MDVFGWAADEAGCRYYRLDLPLKFSGLHHQVDARMPKSWERIPAVIGQRVSNPGASRRWHHLGTLGIRRIFEIDDDLFNVHPSNKQPYALYSRPEVQARLKANIAEADVVVTSTAFLAQGLARLNPNVMVLPNLIDARWLRHARPRRHRLTIGWGGSSSHALDFQAATGALRAVLAKHPEVDFHTIGPNFLGKGPQVRHTPWIQGVDGYMRAIDFDIGIAPLKPSVFNFGKSYIKALELAALGIPVVASDTGPYSSFVKHGETGFLCRSEDNWRCAIETLIRNEDLRTEMGLYARAFASGFTAQIHGKLWAGLTR